MWCLEPSGLLKSYIRLTFTDSVFKMCVYIYYEPWTPQQSQDVEPMLVYICASLLDAANGNSTSCVM